MPLPRHDSANYQLLQVVKKGRRMVKKPVAFQVSYDPSSDSIDVTISGKPAFAAGGELIVDASAIVDPSGEALVGSSNFTISPKARGIGASG